VERAQEIIYLLTLLKANGDIPDLPVFLDSPMGINATKVFLKYPSWHAIGEKRCQDMCNGIHLIKDAAHSRSVQADDSPKIVLAGSGMITGGRVLHYLYKHISNPESTLLLAGFQAAGTRGRQIQEGHADQADLIDWTAQFDKHLTKVLLNHGEPMASHTLALQIQDKLGISAEVAQPNTIYNLESN